jgi:DNA-binding NarL/FixJ family response regulator
MGATILIVDHDPQFRVLLRKLLAQEPDLEVVGEAVDGAEGIRLDCQLRPDIIVMELIMPGVNGLEATRRIKVEHPATKIIIMTVHTDDAYVQAAEASGTDAFLVKRSLMTGLLPTIRRLLHPMAPPNTS